MPMRIFICTILTFNLLFLTGAHGQETGSTKASLSALTIGSPAPVIPLSDLLGRKVDWEPYLGKAPVVLFLWSIHCGSCVKEFQFLQELEDRFRDFNLEVMAVNEDTGVPVPRIRRFTDRLEKYRGKITYPFLYDEGSKLSESLGVSTLPTLVLIDRKGNIAGYLSGHNPEDNTELANRVKTLTMDEMGVVEHETSGPEEESAFFTVTGEASLCGFFDSSGWRKSFTGNESLPQEMELTRDLARRAATRQAVTVALQRLGINIYSREPARGCLNPDGIQLARDPFDTRDPTSNFLSLVNYDDFIDTIEEREVFIDNTYYVARRVKVYLARLKDVMGSLDYLMTPLRIKITYINAGTLDQEEFLSSLIASSRYIGNYEAPVLESGSMTQVLEIYTSSQGFADEILDIDFGSLQVFVEDVTPTSLELEMWR